MLTVEDIRDLISELNSTPSYPESDYLVTKAFARPVDSHTHYERVALLDALFSTKLRQSRPVGNRPRKTIFEISEAIRNILQQLEHSVAPLDEHDLFQLDLTNEQVQHSISSTLQLVLNCLNNISLAFTGKYLHFVFPKVFPLWDHLVPQAVNDIYDDEIFPENNTNTIENYLLLCQKYQQIASHFTEPEINEILQLDYETQPVDWKVENTFLRILDKALWMYQKRNAV